MDRALVGVRVVALEQAIAMPYCTWALAEMGADVIKIERPPSGDVVRAWDSTANGLSSGFVWVNSGKRSVLLDLAQEAGRQAAGRLVDSADVFVENFAVGVADRLGLGWEVTSAGNPGLVYCSLTGYGQDGPYKDRKAYDLLMQGETGLLLTNGTPDQPAKVGIPITDLAAGTNAALAISLALLQRARTGRGTRLDISMFDSTAAWLAYYTHRVWHGAGEPPRTGMRHQFLCPYGPFIAADGRYVNLVVANDHDWHAFCTHVALRPDWIDDPAYASMEVRSLNRTRLDQLVEVLVASEPSSLWLERLAAAGLPFGEVRTIEQVLQHPQVNARELIVETQSPVGALPMVRFPLAPPSINRRLPGLGEHSHEVLRQVGYSHAEIADLKRDGVIN